LDQEEHLKQIRDREKRLLGDIKAKKVRPSRNGVEGRAEKEGGKSVGLSAVRVVQVKRVNIRNRINS